MSDLPSSESGSLCVGCAMCCNGTLYGRARVAEGEAPRIQEHGLELEDFEGKSYFRLPCKYESCSRCTIYETRFEICRSFKCALLRQYEAGEISLEAGREKVVRALELRSAIAATDPDALIFQARQELREQLKQALADGTAQDRPSTARRLLNMAALDALLEHWFRNKKLGSQPAEEAEAASNS